MDNSASSMLNVACPADIHVDISVTQLKIHSNLRWGCNSVDCLPSIRKALGFMPTAA